MARVNKKQVAPKKRKIKYKNIIIFIVLIMLGMFCFYGILNLKIKNIYVSGNTILSDQQLIDMAGLHDYPSISANSSKEIEEKLESNVYVSSAKVRYRYLLREIDIDIKENLPLIYYEYENTYLLASGETTEGSYNLPILINQTPDNKLEKLLKCLDKLDKNVLDRISEIRYYPSKVDEELFYLTMNDGNYVYINFNSFSKLDNYVEIIQKFNNKKGIVHLDSGDYLEIYE